MLRLLTSFVILTVCVLGTLLCSECEAGKKKLMPHRWIAPDSSWGVGGFGKASRELLEQLMAKKPPELDGLKGVELELNEPGVWLGFGVAFRTVDRVVFTKSTKFVLIDKRGKRIQSEAFVFYPDALQTSVFDTRKTAIVLTKNSVWCNPNNGYPSGLVKFPPGSIELKDIASFDVIGAVIDTLRAHAVVDTAGARGKGGAKGGDLE